MNPAFPFAAALLDELARAGATDVCVCPGSRSAPLAVAAAHAGGLRVWTHLDERSAGFFALGLARRSGRPALLVCTSGTAAANFLPAVAEAHTARVPLVVLTADRPPELREFGAGQTIDQLGLYGRHARWFAEAPLPEADETSLRVARSLARRAISVASARPRGAVHLNLPFREPLHPLQVDDLAVPEPEGARPAVRHARAEPLAETVERLATRMARGRGVLLCGPLDADSGLAESVVRLARAAAWPVFADALSGLRSGVHTKEAPILTHFDALVRDPRFGAAFAPELVVQLGDTPTSKATRLWLEAHPPKHRVLVDPDRVWHDPGHRTHEAIDAEPELLCRALAQRLERSPPEAAARAWAARFAQAERHAEAAVRRELASTAALLEPQLVRSVAEVLPEGATLFVSNSMPVRDADGFLPLSSRRIRVLGQRGANGIDGIVSSALGAAAGGEGPLVLLTGDLALLHDLGGLAAAQRHGLRAVFVVVNNGGGGIFDYLPIADWGEAVAFREMFTVPQDLDLRAAARLFGLGYERAERRAAFEEALRASLGARRTTLLEVPVDPAASLAHHRALWRSVAEAAT